MSKIVSIRENGELKQFTTSKIKTLLQNGEYAYWVPEDEIDVVEKTITENGTYVASDEGHHGYSPVTVNVQPNLGARTITENGTYYAVNDDYDGYELVTVNVTGGGGTGAVLTGTTVPTNDLGEDGYVYLLRDDDGSVDTPEWVTTLGYTYVQNLAVSEQGAYLNLGRLPAFDSENPTAEYFVGIYGDVEGTTLTSGEGIFGAVQSEDSCGVYIDEPSLTRGDFVADVEGNTARVNADFDDFNTHSGEGSPPAWYVSLRYRAKDGNTPGAIIFRFYPSSANAVAQDMLLFSATGKTPTDCLVVTSVEIYYNKQTVDGVTTYGYRAILVPARRNSDGALGLFDSLNSTAGNAIFYTNASNTGSFTVKISGDLNGEIIGVYYKENGIWVEIGSGSIPDAGGHYFGTVSSSSESESSQTSESESESESTSENAEDSILDDSDTSASEGV